MTSWSAMGVFAVACAVAALYCFGWLGGALSQCKSPNILHLGSATFFVELRCD